MVLDPRAADFLEVTQSDTGAVPKSFFMTILQTFSHHGKQVDQLYFGGQDIRYQVDGKIYKADKFWTMYPPKN